MIRRIAGPRLASADGVEVIRLDRTGWRVSVASLDERDASRLLGYIERLDSDRYEVLWLAAPISWAYVDSYQLALAAIADRSNFSGVVEPVRDPDIRPNTPPVHTASPAHAAKRRRKGNAWAFAAAATASIIN